MKLICYINSLSRLFWHPQQGLWNDELLRCIKKLVRLQPIYLRARKIIIFIDTVILFVRALARRLAKQGITNFFSRTKIPQSISILYFDLGTHKEAQELELMINKLLPKVCRNFEAYGFEASLTFFEQAQTKFTERKNVKIIHAALCHVIPENGKVKLYKSLGKGLASSIYRSHYPEYEEAQAILFSDWLRKNVHLEKSICLLRMNIEGAEYDVIRDLIDHELVQYIDGYYGMWDDLSKIDTQCNAKFQILLSKHQISPFTFNGRDFTSSLRMRCIAYDIYTHIQAGIRRINTTE